jgi:hypothetical protein
MPDSKRPRTTLEDKARILKARARHLEAKSKVKLLEAKAKKLSSRILEAKAWPRGLYHCIEDKGKECRTQTQFKRK